MGQTIASNDLSNIGQGLSQIPSIKQINDLSSSAIANSSLIDGGSDIGEATTLALNRTKSNDKLSLQTRKTPREAAEASVQKLEKSLASIDPDKIGGQFHGLKKWYYNQMQQHSKDIFIKEAQIRASKPSAPFMYLPSNQSSLVVRLHYYMPQP